MRCGDESILKVLSGPEAQVVRDAPRLLLCLDFLRRRSIFQPQRRFAARRMDISQVPYCNPEYKTQTPEKDTP